MRVRHVFTLIGILFIATIHFAIQWYAWKVHRFEIPLGDSLLAPPADYLWKVCSWPMFALVSRRVQHLHFLAVLIANSLTWGATLLGGATFLWRANRRARLRRKKKRVDAASQPAAVRTAPLTRLERIIELNSLLNRRRITEEEYRSMRKAIMREHEEPGPDSVGTRVVANAAVTYTVPQDVSGAEHVAWLDESPHRAQKRRGTKQESRDERGDVPPTNRPAVRGR